MHQFGLPPVATVTFNCAVLLLLPLLAVTVNVALVAVQPARTSALIVPFAF